MQEKGPPDGLKEEHRGCEPNTDQLDLPCCSLVTLPSAQQSFNPILFL